MDYIWKSSILALICLILFLILAKKDKDIASIITFAGCCMILIGAISYLKPVVDFLSQLQQLGNLDGSYISVLLKAVGIGLLSEIITLLCGDLGNAGLGKTLQIGASAVILWLSIPLFTQLLELISGILEQI